MHLPTVRFFTQPILQTALAVATIGAAALVLGKRAETKLARIPIESDPTRSRPDRHR
jgi:hypothetical protein